ncbi:unnamed protein product [Ectocarpus fasciculatus]
MSTTVDAAAAAGDETGGEANREGKKATANAATEEAGAGDGQQVGGVCSPTALAVSAVEKASQERIGDEDAAAEEASRQPGATFADAKGAGNSSTSPMSTSPRPSRRVGASPPSPSLSSPGRRNEAASPVTATASAAAAAAAAAAATTAAAKLLKQHQEQRAPGPMPANKRRLRIYPTGRNRTSKWVTREIAALDFLTGLRMRNEAAILAQGTNGGGGGSFGISADDETSPSLLDSGSGVGVSGDGSHRGGGWGWDMQKEKSSDDDDNNHGEAGVAEVARGASYPAVEGRAGKTGADGEAKEAKGIEGRSPAGGGVTFADNNNDSDDSDSDNGWLDQPLPSTGRGGASSGHVSAHRLRGATTDRGGTGASAGIGGGGARVSGAGFRRLRGREAAHVRLPANFRHSMQALPGHSAAVVRQWEQGLTRQDRLLEGRLFFSCSKGYPLMVSSVIHYKPQEEQAKRARQKRIDERGAEAFQIPKRDWRGFSYAHLLPASVGAPGVDSTVGSTAGGATAAILGGGGGGGGGVESEGEGTIGGGSVSGGGGIGDGGDGAGGEKIPYKAGFLDDPALKVGRHRHMTKGDRNTGPVVSSVLLFVKPRVLKDELNTRFREEHPLLPPSLTLSKIRSVKRQALLGCYRAGMEVSTVALACIYFERLCLAGVVTKPNRRLAMAACLAIAYKFNEAVLEGVSKLPALWAFIDQEWQVSKKRVLEAEFGVLVQLSFDLHEDPRDIFHHFVLLLKMVESNATLYLGEEMMGLHQESLETFFREGTNEDGARTVSGAAAASTAGGGGQDSPGGGRPVSDSGTAGADAAGRARVHDSQQRSPFLETPAWLQRRPTNRTRWLAGWRAGFAQENDPGTGAGQQPLHAPAPAAGATADRWSKAAATAKLEKLRQAGQGLGKVTRQRSQRLNKDVRSGASSLLAHGISSTQRRRRRRRMEA